MIIKTTRFNLLNDNEPSSLKDLDPYSIYLIGIIASDDSNDHGIAICNGWIFDANVPHALPYCKDGLDYTTYNEMERSWFHKVRCGLRLTEQRKKMVMNMIMTRVNGQVTTGTPPSFKEYNR